MLFIALLAAAGADPALVSQADELNARYTQCLFATSRDAQTRDIAESQFPSLLAASCQSERDQLHQVFLAVRIQRGSSPAQAETDWIGLEAQGSASVERAYAIARGLSQ